MAFTGSINARENSGRRRRKRKPTITSPGARPIPESERRQLAKTRAGQKRRISGGRVNVSPRVTPNVSSPGLPGQAKYVPKIGAATRRNRRTQVRARKMRREQRQERLRDEAAGYALKGPGERGLTNREPYIKPGGEIGVRGRKPTGPTHFGRFMEPLALLLPIPKVGAGIRGARALSRAIGIGRRAAKPAKQVGRIRLGGGKALAHTPLPLAAEGTETPEVGNLPQIPIQTGRALVESGSAREKTLTGSAKILAAVLAAPVQIPKEVISKGPADAAKEFARGTVEDYKRRYGPLLRGEKGSEEAFRKRLAEEGAAPELLDLTGAAAIGGATIGRGAGALARRGALGGKLERASTAPRPKLRVSGGERAVRQQELSNNLFRALAQRGEDRLRVRNLERRNTKGLAQGRGKPGIQPKRGEVVRATRYAQGRGMRMAAGDVSARGFNELRSRMRMFERSARANVAGLSKKQRRAFVMGLEGAPINSPAEFRLWAQKRQREIVTERASTMQAARQGLEQAEKKLASAKTDGQRARWQRAITVRRAKVKELQSTPGTLRGKTEELRVLREIAKDPEGILDDNFRRVVGEEQQRSNAADELNVAVAPTTAEARRLRVQGEMLGVPHTYTVARDQIKAAARNAAKQTKDPAVRAKIRQARDQDLAELDRRKPDLDAQYARDVRSARSIPGKEQKVAAAETAANAALRGLRTTPREIEADLKPYHESTGRADAIEEELFRRRSEYLTDEGKPDSHGFRNRDRLDQMEKLERAANIMGGQGTARLIRAEQDAGTLRRMAKGAWERGDMDEAAHWAGKAIDAEEVARAVHLGYDPRPHKISEATWYHGTPSQLDKFAAERTSAESLMGQGVYLTSNRKIAEGYSKTSGQRVAALTIRPTDEVKLRGGATKPAGSVKVGDEIYREGPIGAGGGWAVVKQLDRGPQNQLVLRFERSNIYETKIAVNRTIDMGAPASDDVVSIFENRLRESGAESRSGRGGGEPEDFPAWQDFRETLERENRGRKREISAENVLTIWRAKVFDAAEYGDMPHDWVEEMHTMLREDLAAAGYDALTHRGGGRVQTHTTHQVVVLLDPEAMIRPQERGKRTVTSIRETKPGPQPSYEMHRELFAGPFPRDDVYEGGRENPAYQEAHAAQRRRENIWQDDMKRALATGRVTPQQALERGYKTRSFEPEKQTPGAASSRREGPDYRPLPKQLWHVTTSYTEVSRAGRLKSRAEQNANARAYRSGAGLGAGPDETISLTDDFAAAKNIHNTIVEAQAVLSGQISPEQLVAKALRGDGADAPYFDYIDREMFSGRGNEAGVQSQGMRDFLGGIVRERIANSNEFNLLGGKGTVKPTAANLRARGYQPLEPIPGTDFFQTWVRPLTVTEHRDKLWDFYRSFLRAREKHGGPPDPMFLSTNYNRLAQIDPNEIRIVETRPRPGARGFRSGDLHNSEWRIPDGALVNIVDAPIDPTALKAVERTQADLQAAQLEPDVAPREIAGEPGFVTHRRRPGPRYADRAPGQGNRAIAAPRQTNMTLYRQGRRDVTPDAYFDTLARQVKYGVNWNMVDEQYRLHALNDFTDDEIARATGKAAPKNPDVKLIDTLTVEDLRRVLERRGLDLDDYGFVNPGVLRKQREGGDEALGEESEPIAQQGLESSPEIRAAFEASAVDTDRLAAMGEGRAAFMQTRGWYAVPKQAFDELDSATKPSGKAGRMLSKVVGFQSRMLLGTSPSWLPFQILANGFVAGFGVRGNVFDAVESVKWYRNLTPEQQHDMNGLLGSGAMRGHGEKMYLGYTGGSLSRQFNALMETPFMRRASRYNPLDLVFRADDAQNAFFRRAVLYSQVKRDAYRRMGAKIPELRDMQGRLIQIENLPPRERINRLLESPELVDSYARKVDEFLGNWQRFSTFERRVMKRGVLFYGFMRYATRMLLYTAPIKHPIVASIVAKLAQLHTEEVADLVGGREAPWAFSRIFFGQKGGELRSIDTLRANPVTSPMVSALESGPRALTGLVSPMLVAALDQMADESHFTGIPYRVRGSTAGVGTQGGPKLPFFSADRGRIFTDDMLSIYSPYRLGKLLSQTGTQGDDSLLFSPRPLDYSRSDAIAREQQRREAQGDTFDKLSTFLAPYAFPKKDTTPEIVKRRQQEAGKAAAGGTGKVGKIKLGTTGKTTIGKIKLGQ